MAEPPPPGPPPFFNFEALSKATWRDGDVVISVPGKSGTTWTMNIVHQLREGGDPDFEDLYKEVKWLEFAMPKQTTSDILNELDEMPSTRHRAFKTHFSPPFLPYVEPEEGNPNVKYICVFRNPEEACVSLFPFCNSMNPDVLTPNYGVPNQTFDTFEEFLEKFYFSKPPEDPWNSFTFLKAWWPHRQKSNVLFMHFADMKKDHEGAVRKIANFLGSSNSEPQFEKVLQYTSFAWMKEHQLKFELPTFFKEGPFLLSGGMVRKGKVGSAKEDGMTEEVSKRIRDMGIQILGEENPALNWFYQGGPLPE